MAIVRVNFKDIATTKLINIDGGITASKIKQEYNPDVFINGALYDSNTKLNIVHMLTNKKYSGYLFSEHGLGIRKNEIIWCTLEKAKTDNSIFDFIGGAPVLVVDAKVNIYWGNKVSDQIKGEKIRTAIGINDDEVILYTSEDAIKLETLAERMVAYGCKYAINCDGGGSSHLYANNKTYKTSVRANPSWLLINKKEVTQMPKKFKVCIDAGHGGSDPGAIWGNLYEKNINLKIANMLKDYLEPYVDVVMTRTTDITLSLEERARIANDADVDLYFSVHCNSASNTAAKGWECYIISKGGKAEILANKIRAKIFLNTSLPLKDRGIKTASYYVLRYTDAPAVLVENAFLSNSDDRNNILKSDINLNYLATCYSEAILELLDIEVKTKPEETDSFNWALTVLEANGVITGSEYWKNNKDKVQYLEQLIINMANYIEKNK